VIAVEHVWKAYPAWPPGSRTVRGLVSRRAPLALRRGPARFVLRDVSVRVEAGRCVGIIGRNGAGKSTLLRLASGLGRPTRGSVAAPDDVASILSIGDTLDLSLSGRENALTAALVAGWSRREAHAVVPAALAFAGLEDRADAPVRTYSDGMRLRLAFGVLAQRRPQALVVDEVLAVGDLAFQAKCLAHMRSLREHGTAVLLASHDLSAVRRECDEAVWLAGGRVVAAGPADAVVDAYEEAARQAVIAATPPDDGAGPLRLRQDRVGTQEATLEDVEVRAGEVVARVAPRGVPLVDPVLQVAVGELAVSHHLGIVEDPVTVRVALDTIALPPGEHAVDVGLYSADWETTYDYHWHAYTLRVTYSTTSP
jgi:lipopolysaccharide transport system ATP-binding protein